MTMHEDRPPTESSNQPVTEEPSLGTDPPMGPGADARTTPVEGTPAAHRDPGAETTGPLVPEDVQMDFRSRWEAVQQGFVDDPRTAVTDADRLVGDVLQRLSTTFEEQHRDLERQWSDGEPSTEDLRGALQRYRTFFDRLLTL